MTTSYEMIKKRPVLKDFEISLRYTDPYYVSYNGHHFVNAYANGQFYFHHLPKGINARTWLEGVRTFTTAKVRVRKRQVFILNEKGNEVPLKIGTVYDHADREYDHGGLPITFTPQQWAKKKRLPSNYDEAVTPFVFGGAVGVDYYFKENIGKSLRLIKEGDSVALLHRDKEILRYLSSGEIKILEENLDVTTRRVVKYLDIVK